MSMIQFILGEIFNEIDRIWLDKTIDSSFQTSEKLCLVFLDQFWVRVIVDFLMEMRELLPFKDGITEDPGEVILMN